jgi:hypothetical protein
MISFITDNQIHIRFFQIGSQTVHKHSMVNIDINRSILFGKYNTHRPYPACDHTPCTRIKLKPQVIGNFIHPCLRLFGHQSTVIQAAGYGGKADSGDFGDIFDSDLVIHN